MKRKLLSIVVIMILVSGVLYAGAGGGSARSADPNVFTLLVDADRSPGNGWFGLYDVIARETGVRVELMTYPYAAAVEQKNIRLSTGDYPDAMGGWIVSSNDIMQLSAQKVIIPLETLIMSTVNVREALEVPGVRATMTLPDGHIYSPPYLVKEPLVSFLPYINQTWLTRLGLQMPQTTDQLRAVLIAFRDRIGTENGQRIIPFSADPNNFDIGLFTGWWGINAAGSGSGSGVNAGGFAVINGRVESTIIRNEFRDTIRFFAQLNADRLIDQELFTQDKATWEAKGKLGLYGMSLAYGAGDFCAEVNPLDLASDPSRNWSDYVPLPVLRAGTAQPVFRNNNHGNTTFRTQFVITDKAGTARTQNIMKWLDATYSPQHSLEQNAGPMEGTPAPARGTWRIISQNGNRVIYQGIDTTSWPEDDRQKNGWSGWSVAPLPRYQRPTWEDQPRPGWENAYKEKDIADEMYRPFLETTPMPALWHNEADAAQVAQIQTAISEYVRTTVAAWVTGQTNINNDAEWNTYLSQLDRLGLQTLLNLKRTAAAAALR